jgi:predicted O-methyltransferase YrrM
MSRRQTFLPDEAARYVDGLFPVPFKSMEAMEEEIERAGRPAIGRAMGSVLRALAAAADASRVLEVGTNVGYSALWLAAGLAAGGHVDTIELDGDVAARAKRNFADAGQAARVAVHVGAALDVLPGLAGPYDVVFLDAVKSEYPRYLDHALRLLRPGGVLAADNVFWSGEVWDRHARDAEVEGLREYTRRVTTDPRLVTTLVPSEDGLMVSVVRRNH